MATIQEEELRLGRILRSDEKSELEQSEWWLSAKPKEEWPSMNDILDETLAEEAAAKKEEVIEDVITPKIPTKEDAVVIWDEITGEAPEEPTSLFDWLDREGIISVINKWDDKSKSLVKELKNRRDIEWVTWEQDPILKNIWFSTIKDEVWVAESVLSDEVSLNFADKLISWAFEKEWLSTTSDDTKISDFLKWQWLTDTQIKQILKSRDFRLKEERIKWAWATSVEAKEALLEDALTKKTEQINKQVTAQQKLLQRQRSLRWVWRSSATEADMVELQEKWDSLISSAQAASKLELDIFKAKQEWADEKRIASLQESLTKANTALQTKLQSQLESQAELVAQWKIESQSAFDSLVGSLEIAWVDKDWIDKNATELLWYVSDKFGNPVMVDWKKVNFSWAAWDADAVTWYVEDILAWRLTRWEVPSKIRNKVISALALKRDPSDILSATQITESRSLAKELFGSTKTENVNAIQSLMSEWLSSKEIKKQLSEIWFSEDYTWALRNAMSSATIAWFTKEEKWSLITEFNRRLDEEDEASAKEFLLQAAVESTWEKVKEKMQGRKDVIWALTDIAKDLQAFQEWGWDTWILTGVTETFESKVLWATQDPKLAAIASKIALAIQEYRQSRSGAAFSESEAKEYADVFPGIWKVAELNAAKIFSIIDVFNNSTNNFYESKFWATNYNKVFPDWVLSTLYPGVNIPWQTWISAAESTITSQSSDDEISNLIFGWDSGIVTETITDIKLNVDSTDDDLDSFFWDKGLDNAEQPATPKGKIGWILWPLQNKVTVIEKWWDNTVLWLSWWSLTFRTNNPLAITATWTWSAERLTTKFWAIPDLFSPDSVDNLVLNFKTVEEWLKAWRQLLESKWNLSINKLLESHTWTSATWHKAQATKLWLDLNKTYASLNESEKNKVIEAIKIGEWFRKWTINS